MNRIYQGRVIKCELLEQKKDGIINEFSKEESSRILWDFHVLFQDAVNYYLVCLMSLANDPKNPVKKIRDRVDGDDLEYNVWKPFRRKGQKRKGMRDVAQYFGLDPETATLEECCAKVLDGNNSDPALLDLALLELLDECASGDVSHTGKEMFPRFCSPRYDKSYPADKRAKKQAQSVLSQWFYDDRMSTEEIVEKLQFSWFANINVTAGPKRGDTAKLVLKEAVHYLRGKNLLSESDSVRLSGKIETLDSEIEFPAYTGGSINKAPLKLKFYTYLILRHVEASEGVLSILRNAYPKPKQAKKQGTEIDFLRFGDDPIKLARCNASERFFVFKPFTVLEHFEPTSGNEPRWRDFDITAFIEALKAFHQIDLKQTERQKDKVRQEKLLKYMDEGQGDFRAEQTENEFFEEPPVLKGDPRIERLMAVHEELKRPSEMAEDGDEDYGLAPRTIRGFEKLAEKWMKVKVEHLSPVEAQAKLKEKLNELQKEEQKTIGSVELFEKLMHPDNWIIWQQSFENTPPDYIDRQFARNPLDAYVQKLDLKEEIKRLAEPIRFTPADPRHSRRQYQFCEKFTPKGQYHYERNSLAVIVGMAIRDGGIWKKQRVRLHYSAPRFLRDGLRSDAEELTKMPWLQPMMEALCIETAFPQDMHDVPVFLMPKRGRNDEIVVNLNFPVTLDETALVSALGRRDHWEGQFAGGREKNIYLRWPTDEWPKGWTEPRWYQDPKPFRLLSVDLGVRDAGAMALVECRPDGNFGMTKDGKPRHSRFIGDADGKKWSAAVIKTKMLRLPGEDAVVWREGELCQEFSGEKGRLATVSETAETSAIITKLGYFNLLNKDHLEERFLAHQNQKLLLALRWAQKRLARWQGWSWMLLNEERAAKAREELQSETALSDELEALVKAEKWTLVPEQLNTDIEALKALLVEKLVVIANRVIPLRGRNWEWSKRQDEAGYVLCQTERGSDPSKTKIAGQRGLSIERIEQIEDLRKRCHSLNKALQHVPGTKPRLGFRSKGCEAADPCPDLLEKLDNLREQRVNQTAHLILAEALGVQLRLHQKPKGERLSKDIHGEYEKVREPVDFIVLEDLNRYLTSQGRSRTENSRLMKWCHRAILGKLKQLCETYGIPVLETAAAYSSRFSAKDGTPGFRAKEVTLADRSKFPWEKMLENEDADAENVKILFRLLEEISAGQNPNKPRKLLAPIAGGPIFVPMAGKETQADINAAINLGLRAVAAPEVLEIHHKIRTEKVDDTLMPLVRSNREKARWKNLAESFVFEPGVKLDRNSNCFPLAGFSADFENCTLNGSHFATGKELWGTIKARQWERIHALNSDRIRRSRDRRSLLPENDLRY